MKTSNRKWKNKNLVATKCLIFCKRNPPWKVPNIFRTHEKRCFKTKWDENNLPRASE